jgi:hypothetical protein
MRKKELSPQEIEEEMIEYARLNRMIVDLNEVEAIEWKILNDETFETHLNQSVRFHMKSGRYLQRRMAWPHLKKILRLFKEMKGGKTIDSYNDEEE